MKCMNGALQLTSVLGRRIAFLAAVDLMAIATVLRVFKEAIVNTVSDNIII